MAEPTVQDVLSKPDFDKLLPGVQFKVLAKVDPSLNSLSEEARPVILKRLKDKYGKRTKGGWEEKLPTEVPDPIRREAQFWDAATNRGIKTVGKVGEWLMSPANIPGTDQTPGPAAQAIHRAINDPEHFPEATTPAGKRGELFDRVCNGWLPYLAWARGNQSSRPANALRPQWRTAPTRWARAICWRAGIRSKPP